ncbi:MAG: ExbD/TolR family protein [Candidatus Muiribacteriaceae bacterium]
MKRINNIWQDDESLEVNISPLIDMMFLLLIFFIVTASFVQEAGVEINRPSASTGRTMDKQNMIIGVDRDNRIFVGGDEIDLSQVSTLVASYIRNEKAPVIVVADEDSYSGKVIEVIDACRKAGAEDVSVATEEK